MTFYLPLMKVFEEDRVSESQLIQDIKFTRHRLELMFRVAHMNRDKTKLLVKTMDPGDPSEGTVSRPPRYNPQQILEIPMVSESKSNVNFERAVREADKTELSFRKKRQNRQNRAVLPSFAANKNIHNGKCLSCFGLF